jgi:RNA polymerase sigma factor (sigma-70 family)
MLLRLARGITLDAALAEDLVQELLIKVHRRWSYISRLDTPDLYIRRMLINEYISWRRKWARIQPAATIALIDTEPDVAQTHADRQLLRAEILKLPRRQQVVLALRYYGGLSDIDIAEAMGCTPGTVRGYASRALRALRIDSSSRWQSSVTAETAQQDEQLFTPKPDTTRAATPSSTDNPTFGPTGQSYAPPSGTVNGACRTARVGSRDGSTPND